MRDKWVVSARRRESISCANNSLQAGSTSTALTLNGEIFKLVIFLEHGRFLLLRLLRGLC